jgi:hypothetical protein
MAKTALFGLCVVRVIPSEIARLRANWRSSLKLFGKPYWLYRLRSWFVTKQNRRCAICGMSFELSTPTLDHCHNTNRVRGALCGSCNLGIGCFKDSVPALESAISYLRADYSQHPLYPADPLNFDYDGWLTRQRFKVCSSMATM